MKQPFLGSIEHRSLSPDRHSPPKHQAQLHHTNHSSQKTPILNESIFLNKKIVSPQKLKILVLSGNELGNEQLEFLSKCINLVKLDLSHNYISKLYSRFGIKNIDNLRVLNLDSNRLVEMNSVESIFGLKRLNMLSYLDNPLEENPKAEHLLVNNLLDLKVINNRIVFVEERDPNLAIDRKLCYISDTFQEWVPTEHSERYYLRVLKLQMNYIDNMWMFANPIIKLQRIWIGILDEIAEQKALENQKQNIITTHRIKQTGTARDSQISPQLQTLQGYFQAWRQTAENLKAIKEELRCEDFVEDSDSEASENEHEANSQSIRASNKQYMTYNLHEYFLAKRNLKIKDNLSAFVKMIREKLYIRKMANIFRRNIRLKKLSFETPETSYFALSGLKESRVLYFNRAQQHLIENFLSHISKNYSKEKQIYEDSRFGICNKYVAIRLMDPDTYSVKKVNNPFTYLMWPCMKAVILKRKRFQFKQRKNIVRIKSINYIKNRDMRLTPKEYKKSVEVYKRTDRFFQNEYYDSLASFECSDDFVLKQLIRMLYYHNTKSLEFNKIIERSEMMSLLENYNEPISIYTDKLLERTTSAVKIQQQWRRFIANRKQKEGIYEKLKKNRAARLIQRFYRDRPFHHRVNFQRNISGRLEQFKSNEFLIHESLYYELPRILQRQPAMELYKGLKIQMGAKMRIFHENTPEKQVFFPTLRQKHFSGYQLSTNNRIHAEQIDICMILHQNSQVRIVECGGQKFYSFVFEDKKQAKVRAACIALLSYRIYGSRYIMPLPRDGLVHAYNTQIVEQYKNFGVDCAPLVSGQREITLVASSNISERPESTFIYIQPKYEVLFNNEPHLIKAKADVEFYQKRYQNFPEKYSDTLQLIKLDSGIIRGDEKDSSQVLNIEKLLIKREELQNSKEMAQGSGRNAKINVISSRTNVQVQQQKLQTNDKNTLNKSGISAKLNQTLDFQMGKTQEKRLSLYALDGPIINYAQRQEDLRAHTQEMRKVQAEQQEVKKIEIEKKMIDSKLKQSFYMEKRQNDLSKLREKRKQEKMMNMTLKSLNQSQRMELVKKKVQKIKELKQRSTSKDSKNKASESDFMQQGNFIMDQQLKMTSMRTKLKEHEKLRQKRKSLSQSKNYPATKTEESGTKSFRSVSSSKQHPKKKFMFESDNEVYEIGRVLPAQRSGDFEPISKEIRGGESQIVNKRPYIKKRSSKTGAYLRDPSFVHGVFPEEYFPIESTRGGITFPRVG